MRRPSSVEVMLLTAIGLWALNVTVTRYLVTNAFEPLAYGAVRYGLAALVFAGIGLATERSLRLRGRDLAVALTAGAVLYVNQIGFVYSLRTTSASVISLILATTPVVVALIGLVLRSERLHRRFWIGTALSVTGVGVVAAATGGELSGGTMGVLLGLLTAITWGIYTLLVTPLMRRHSATRISATILAAAWVPLTLTALPQLGDQDWSLGGWIWALLVFATLGPLVLTNILWFRSVDRIGPARATLATNIQPFIAALIAIVLLGEPLAPTLLLGGALIAAGILVARRRAPVVPAD
jgi:drug/metabolite transporter (DMT)-like permease